MADSIEFEGWSYRTSCRFGGPTRISLNGGTVTITGPRVKVPAFRLWTAGQVFLFWMILPMLLASALLWDWELLAVALTLLVMRCVFIALGGEILWRWADATANHSRSKPSILFPATAVKRISIDRGWIWSGMALVIPHSVGGILSHPRGRVVSFEALDVESDSDYAVYAFRMRNEQEAAVLAALLKRRAALAQFGLPLPGSPGTRQQHSSLDADNHQTPLGEHRSCRSSVPQT